MLTRTRTAACVLALMILPLAPCLAQGAGGVGGGPNTGGTAGAGPGAAGLNRTGPTAGAGMTPGSGGVGGAATGMAAGSGIGNTGTSPGYGGTAGAGTATGNTMGTGTGVGIGSTSLGQTTAQSPVGQPITPSTTPGGPPNANTTNMSGIGGNSPAGR